MATEQLQFDRIRILVLGDSNVGKTSLVDFICSGSITKNHVPTIGCNLEVKLHTSLRSQKQYFVEFIDIAGKWRHQATRKVFYRNINGIILVHDLNSKKSLINLWNWANEVSNALSGLDDFSVLNQHVTSNRRLKEDAANTTSPSVSISIGPSSSVPYLIVGTKLDLFKYDNNYDENQVGELAKNYNATRVEMSTIDTSKIIVNGRPVQKANPFSEFFDNVLECKKYGRFYKK